METDSRLNFPSRSTCTPRRSRFRSGQPGNIAVELFDETAEGERPLLDRRFTSDELEGLKQSNVVGEFYALQLTLSDDELRQLSTGGAGYRVSFQSLRDDSKVTSFGEANQRSLNAWFERRTRTRRIQHKTRTA